MEILDNINQLLQKGKAKDVKDLCQQAIDSGIDASEVLEGGLLAGMNIVGQRFKKNEVFVPEVLIAARAMNSGLEVLKPYLAEGASESKGKVVIGTVKGDLHDIGKNLVKIMMEGKGLDVIDLGTNVTAEQFMKAAEENGAKVIACSALLTTTMNYMKDVVEAFKAAGKRDGVTIMVGGAPVTENFCQTIGADIFTPDATTAAERALEAAAS